MTTTLAGGAATRWNDYLGTVAADDAPVAAGGPSLYQLVGLDRDHWIVVGADLTVQANVPELTVYAAARGTDARAKIDDLIDANGQLQVTGFSITDPHEVEQFFTEAFGQLSISLRPRELDHPIQVIERRSVHQGATD